MRVDGQELSLGQARLLSGKRGTFAEVVSMLLRNPNFPLYFQPELLGTSSSALELPPGVEGVSHAVRCIAYSTMAATRAASEGAAEGRNVCAAFLCGRRGPRATGEEGETSCYALVLAQLGVRDRLFVKLLGTHLHEAGPCCVHAAADCEACVQAGLFPRPTPSAGLHATWERLARSSAAQLFEAKLLLSGAGAPRG